LPSPGLQVTRSFPAPRSTTSSPRWPSTKSLPAPPASTSAPSVPTRVSPPAPPSAVKVMTPAGTLPASTRSSPPSVLMVNSSVAAARSIVTNVGPRTNRSPPGSEHADQVVVAGAVEDDPVDLVVRGSAPLDHLQVDAQLLHGGAGEVVEGHG